MAKKSNTTLAYETLLKVILPEDILEVFGGKTARQHVLNVYTENQTYKHIFLSDFG